MTLPFSQPSWFSSEDFASMTLNNVAGSLLEVIRGCAVTGYNPHPVTSIVVNAGVAVASCAAHGYTATYGKLLLIAGASEPLLNGRKQPTAVLTNSFTFPAPGVADGTYTGSMSARRAPLGWVEAHTGTNVAMFARSAVEATSMLLRVDDTGGGMARTRMVETATSVSVFTGPAPTDAQTNGGGYWQKAGSAAANGWVLVGDSRGFWLGTGLNGAAKTYVYYFFGDGVPYYAPDAYFCVVTGQITSSFSLTPGFQPSSSALYSTNPSGGQVHASRGIDTASFSSEPQGLAGANTNLWGGSTLQPVTFEHVVFSDTVHVIGNGRVVRGELPGLSVPLAAAPFESLVPVTASGGRVYLPVSFNTGGSVGQVCFRLSDTWY